MKILRVFAGAVLLAASALGASAQVDNYALRFSSPQGVVNLGRVGELTSADDYTLQLWFNPSQWSQGASILRCGTFSIKLGVDHALVINDGLNHLTLTSSEIAAGKWTHLTLRTSAAGGTAVTVNGTARYASAAPILLPAADKSLWLGGDFTGRIDEVRLWNGQLPEDYNSFWRTTLNELNPSWDSLAAYWKMDQEQCAALVDYKGEHHGTLSADGVEKAKVTDNDRFKYLLNLAYGNIERFFDRKISGRHYSLSNRVSIIGATVNTSTGHATLYVDRNDAALTGGAKWEAGRNGGTMAFGGGDDCLTLPGAVLSGAPAAYAFEAWVRVDEWTEGATLFSKGSAFSVNLGTKGVLKVTVNGTEKSVSNMVPTGRWVHIGVSPSDSGVNIEIGGENCSVSATISAALAASTAAPVVGRGLIGAMDDVMVWKGARSVADMIADSKRLPLPDADYAISGSLKNIMDVCYSFENESQPGYDYFSVEHFFNTMRSYTEGMRGVKFTLTVGANNFDGCLANANLRRILAADIAEMGNNDAFDGVDLDFEWTYTAAGWNNIALLCEAIRSQLKPGKILSVSPHKVAYAYPVDKMNAVDYFNFQVYGPGDRNLFTRDGYQQASNAFINHGYPKDKIILSYATTTTGGMNANGGRVANTHQAFYPAGYKGIYVEGTTQPSDDRIAWSGGDGVYYFLTGFDQTVWRSQYAVENDLGGIMYWDLGNDLAPTHPASLARGASYAINSNVEPLVKSVPSAAPAPGDDPYAPVATEDPDDQGGFDPAAAAEAISEALAVYSRYPGYHPAGSPERAALLEAINRAKTGQADAASVNAAVADYLAAVNAETVSGPAGETRYYVYGVSSYDETARYLYTDANAVKVTSFKPETLTEVYEWTAVDNGDGTFALCNSEGKFIAAPTSDDNGLLPALTDNRSEARAFPVTAGNKAGRLQLTMSDTQYLETRYEAANNPNGGMGVVINKDADCDGNNPKRWSGQWVIAEVEPVAPKAYTINAGTEGGSVNIGAGAAAGHGDVIHYDPAIGLSINCGTTTTGVKSEFDHENGVITLIYTGLSTTKGYRLRNLRSDSGEYMTFSDSKGLVAAPLDANNPQQIFSFVSVGEGKFALAAQGTHVGPAAETGGVQVTASDSPAGYYVIERGNGDGSYAFDRAKVNGGTWADGSRALSCPNGQSNVSPWGTGVVYSWWMPEEVNEVTVTTTGGYASVCMPFAFETEATVYVASVHGGSVLLSKPESSVIPAGEPVVISSDAQTVALIPVFGADAEAQALEGNALGGNLFAGEIPAGAYTLQAAETPEYVPATQTSMPRNSSWLPGGQGGKMPVVFTIDDTNSIGSIGADESADKSVYDLQGRRVVNPGRGLYIVGGKLTRL